MATVRLEIEVPDEAGDELANELASRHVRVSVLSEGWRAVTVRVLPDAEIRRERDILRALAHFLPQAREG